ncbi:MAG: transporter, partial [Armatimonadota bacterium]
MAVISGFLAPLMRLIGLPGQAALVFLSGALLNNYSAIAVMGTVALSLRDATILAVMCVICHNLLVETTVMKSAGSSAIKM